VGADPLGDAQALVAEHRVLGGIALDRAGLDPPRRLGDGLGPGLAEREAGGQRRNLVVVQRVGEVLPAPDGQAGAPGGGQRAVPGPDVVDVPAGGGARHDQAGPFGRDHPLDRGGDAGHQRRLRRNAVALGCHAVPADQPPAAGAAAVDGIEERRADRDAAEQFHRRPVLLHPQQHGVIGGRPHSR
jgi:hypothetical protein